MRLKRRHQRIAPPAPELLPAVIESLLFVAEEPQDIGALAKSLNVPRQGAERAVEALAASTDGRGIFVQRLGDRVQLATAPEAAPYIERFLELEHGRLSRAALETLAIIAYRQPVTRAAIESVRGVNSDHAVATLVARGLIEETGRAPGPGRPVLFGTSVRFLEHFGLQRPDDLPPLPEVEPSERDTGEAEPASESPDGMPPMLEQEPSQGETEEAGPTGDSPEPSDEQTEPSSESPDPRT